MGRWKALPNSGQRPGSQRKPYCTELGCMHHCGKGGTRGGSREPQRVVPNPVTLSRYWDVKEAEAPAILPALSPLCSVLLSWCQPWTVRSLPALGGSSPLHGLDWVLGKNGNSKEYNCFRLLSKKILLGAGVRSSEPVSEPVTYFCALGKICSHHTFKVWWILQTSALKYFQVFLLVSAVPHRKFS